MTAFYPLLSRPGMSRPRLAVTSLILCLLVAPALALNRAAVDSGQLVVVITENWQAARGELYRFVRGDVGWQSAGPATPVSIGKSGLGWGRGLHEPQQGPQKREGDGRSPAGVFTLGTAFGYADEVTTRLRYQAMSRTHYCIDVVDSADYNQIIDAATAGATAVTGSTEPMRRDLLANGDQRYKIGFVVNHNPDALPGAGSCIFFHLWREPGEPTIGCTAMAEPDMNALLDWLDAKQTPLLVALPRSEYRRLREPWALPRLPE